MMHVPLLPPRGDAGGPPYAVLLAARLLARWVRLTPYQEITITAEDVMACWRGRHTTGALLRRYQTALDAQLALRVVVQHYGRHLPTCELLYTHDKPCSCGFTEVLAALRAPEEGL